MRYRPHHPVGLALPYGLTALKQHLHDLYKDGKYDQIRAFSQQRQIRTEILDGQDIITSIPINKKLITLTLIFWLI